jgi:hypothetical protein
MKTDTYTKIVLTVISICLSFNVLKDLQIIPSVQAMPENNVIDINIKQINGRPLYDYRLPISNK